MLTTLDSIYALRTAPAHFARILSLSGHINVCLDVPSHRRHLAHMSILFCNKLHRSSGLDARGNRPDMPMTAILGHSIALDSGALTDCAATLMAMGMLRPRAVLRRRYTVSPQSVPVTTTRTSAGGLASKARLTWSMAFSMKIGSVNTSWILLSSRACELSIQAKCPVPQDMTGMNGMTLSVGAQEWTACKMASISPWENKWDA